MSDDYENLWDALLADPGPDLFLEVVREVEEPGRSFSGPALDALIAQVTLWIGTRIQRKHDESDEPPTVIRVSVSVDVL